MYLDLYLFYKNALPEIFLTKSFFEKIFAFIFAIYYKFCIKDNTAEILVLVLHLNTKRKVVINLGNIIAC
jgi:hypothetical protein